jgi:hypothetical protein
MTAGSKTYAFSWLLPPKSPKNRPKKQLLFCLSFQFDVATRIFSCNLIENMGIAGKIIADTFYCYLTIKFSAWEWKNLYICRNII